MRLPVKTISHSPKPQSEAQRLVISSKPLLTTRQASYRKPESYTGAFFKPSRTIQRRTTIWGFWQCR